MLKYITDQGETKYNHCKISFNLPQTRETKEQLAAASFGEHVRQGECP